MMQQNDRIGNGFLQFRTKYVLSLLALTYCITSAEKMLSFYVPMLHIGVDPAEFVQIAQMTQEKDGIRNDSTVYSIAPTPLGLTNDIMATRLL